MLKKTVLALAATSTLVACASPPKDIAPAYVSTGLYENLSCAQLRNEAQAVSNRAAAAFGQQEKNRNQDAAMTGVALVIFWPAALFMKGDGAAAAEVARLKGEMQAIEQVNRIKNCGIQFAPIA
jgi:ABC-type hemin transport system substrate-binding protein